MDDRFQGCGEFLPGAGRGRGVEGGSTVVALEVSEDLGQVQGIDGERRIEEAKGKIEGCQGTPVAVIHGQDQVLDSGTDFHGDSQDGVFRRLRQGATEGGFVPGYQQISQIPEIAVGLSWLGWGLTTEYTGGTEGEKERFLTTTVATVAKEAGGSGGASVLTSRVGVPSFKIQV